MMDNYILNEQGEPVVTDDLMAWADFYEHDPRRFLAQTQVGVAMVSTVFLGIDHSWEPGAKPILWETMIFGGAHDQEQWRYTSKEEALHHHKVLVAQLEQETKEKETHDTNRQEQPSQ